MLFQETKLASREGIFKNATGNSLLTKFTQTFQEQGAQLAMRKHFFVPSLAMYHGENTYILVVNPVPTQLIVIDILKIDPVS